MVVIGQKKGQQSSGEGGKPEDSWPTCDPKGIVVKEKEGVKSRMRPFFVVMAMMILASLVAIGFVAWAP